ncbi:MAG TPA: hypothetical protein VIQ76_11570 [Propionibacteriaceae bacterium]|jgi:hypothetical protein
MSHIQCAPERMYRARWLGADGREPSRTFTRKAEAERHLATVEVAKLPGVYTSNANPVTMGEYTRRWAGTGPHRPIRATRLASLINKHIYGEIGSMRLAAVRSSQVQGWGQRPIPSSLTWHSAASVGAFADPSSRRPSKIGSWRPTP